MDHHPLIQKLLVEEHIHDLEQRADEDRAARPRGRRNVWSRMLARLRGRPQDGDGGAAEPGTIRIRYAGTADELAVRSLATRANACPPAAPVLVLDLDGRVMAAKSLSDGDVVADPANRGLAELVSLRADQIASGRCRLSGG